MGANDYLSKLFDFMELEARIRTLSRIEYIQHGNELSCGGIPQDEMHYIFEPYYRINKSRNQKRGRGPWIVHRKDNNEKHGWNINVESEVVCVVKYRIE